jgi:ketosteroid isomerase-like protein
LPVVTAKGEQQVRGVFAAVAAGDADGAAALYAPDGVIQYSATDAVEGREAIRAFYAMQIETIAPQPSVEAVLEQHPRYVAIVNVPTGDRFRRAADHFTLGDDGIERLEIFAW